MMTIIAEIIFLSILTIFISYFVHRRINYFEKFKIPYERLNILFGNAKNSTLGKWSVAHEIDRIYTKFKGRGLCAGFMNNFTPYFLPLNPEISKQVMIAKFSNFRNNDFSFETQSHTIISLNTFWLRNEMWKTKRSELSPALTALRLKAIYPLIDEAAKDFSDYVRGEIKKSTSMMTLLDVRDISLRYSCNSITSTTYGLNAQAYKGASDILENGRKLWQSISASTWLPTSPIKREVNQFFIKLATHAVQRRRYNNEKRNDLLNFIIQLKNKRNCSEIETAAHAMKFFLDGFETSSLALCYVLYELSKNLSVQQKLRMEINEILDDKTQSLSIDSLLNLTYLDQVFYEALRLHPPLFYTTRVCNEATELVLDDEKILIPKDTAMLIPIYSVHRDPDFYENPNEFIPERFNEEYGGVKAYRDKCILIPFGEGSRICLGQNLGQLQVKAAIVELLRNFELVCCKSVTEDDLMIMANQLSSIPKGKVLVEFRLLNEDL